jgi:hypothetical protein
MRNEAENTIRLSDIGGIHPGYPFRGPINEAADGDAAVVQIKNVDAEQGIDWSALVRTRLEGRRKPDWLRQGDIVFTARGNRNAAAPVERPPQNAVSAPHLFVIRLIRHDQALPAFIAWLMNQPDAQRYFAQSATGSYITSIRKDVLQQMPLRLPTIEKQELIVRLDQAVRRERQLLKALIENRRTQLNLVARSLVD